MANKIKYFKARHLLLLFPVLFFFNCYPDADFTGFIRSTDRVNDRFEQSEEWNKNHPFINLVVNTNNYQILVAADSHIGGVKNFNLLLDEAKKPANTAFVLVGDIVTGKKEDYLVFKNQLPDFAKTPYFLLTGNHDLYFDGWKLFYDYFGSSTYYFTIQTPAAKDIFICLDTGGGTLGDKQLAWLKNILSTERDNHRHCFVFTHVNFFRNRHTGSTNLLVPEINVLLDLFVQHRVNMVITGHDHIPFVHVFGNTTYITLAALADFDRNASYLKLGITEGKTGYEFISLQPIK